MIVMKFGGSSVANRKQIEKVLAIVRGRAGRTPLVVSSAHKGMTDALLSGAREAARGVYAPERVIERQAAIARDLGCDDALLAPFYEEISALYRGLSLVRELSLRSLDYAASFGERMAVRVIADFFTREGLPAQAFDVWDLGFLTDGAFGSARPLPGYEAAMQRAVRERVPAGVVPVVTGFVGKTEAGDITTVGRNGSDLTATLVGAAIAAEEVEIWSDTDGVMTADPSVVKKARSISEMRFDEAAELAYFGSRVLHPSTLVPAMQKNIPVRVLNTNRPEHPGTVIREAAPPSELSATSIAYKEGQLAVTIRSTRMFGAAGFLGEAFQALGRHEVVVDMIATSEVSVSFTTDRREPLDRALPDLERLGEVRVEAGKTLMVVVGRRLAAQAGLGAAILQAVADAGVNVEMVSYGMKSISLTMLVADKDVGAASAVLHERLFERA
ncbi:aspartate kinase [Polyangium sorediatum]|uniref:Aspartokinase n=1 Tax=Polyangium sorediatum TaxID=889274 RepID=A0ABT6P2Y5_9BACT|nr:aspartate kinase [Polyangium sorediatum]MDI1434969.1 aspartate kinase [Polyangium sorediatum]